MATNKKTVTEKDELKIINPSESITLSTGETVTISPFKFKDFPPVIKIISDYAGNLTGALDPLSIAQALTHDGGQGIFTLIRLSTGLNQDEFDELSAEDGITILAEIISLNFDFFTQKILPKINDLGSKLGAKAGA